MYLTSLFYRFRNCSDFIQFDNISPSVKHNLYCIDTMAGRGPAARHTVVQDNDILGLDMIRAEKVTFRSIIFPDKLQIITWLAKHRLIKNTRICEVCELPTSLIKKSTLSDLYTWKCKVCRKTVSIREGSFFSNSRLELEQAMIIIYGWCRDFSQANIAHEAGLAEHYDRTMTDWCNFCRDICEPIWNVI